MEIFYPVMLLIFHTFAVASYMGYRRATAVSRGEVDPHFYKLYVGQEPDELRVLTRHVTNLMETPVFFYLGAVIAYITGQGGTTLLVLAWAYVVLRLVHSAVHLGGNVVIWRFRVFIFSVTVLAAFLALITIGLFKGG